MASDAEPPLPRLTGRVEAGGPAPVDMVLVRASEGQTVRIVGTALAELQRLGGATVTVEGDTVHAIPWPEMQVARYHIVSVDGQEPMVGIIRDTGGRLSLVGEGDSVPLAAPPERLLQLVGAKVYVVGVRAGGALRVQSFGVLKEPGT